MNIYRTLGVCDEVYEYGEGVLASLKDRFETIDAMVSAIRPRC